MTFTWTTIHVRDLDQSLAFYHDLLGLPIQERFGPPGHEIAMLGPEEGTRLELIGGGEIPEHPAPTLSLGFAPENMGQLLARPGGSCHPHPTHVPQPRLTVLLPGGPRRLHRAVGGVRNPLIPQNNRAQRKFSAPCFVLSRHQPCARPLISVTVRQNTQVRSKTPSGKSQSVRPL